MSIALGPRLLCPQNQIFQGPNPHLNLPLFSDPYSEAPGDNDSIVKQRQFCMALWGLGREDPVWPSLVEHFLMESFPRGLDKKWPLCLPRVRRGETHRARNSNANTVEAPMACHEVRGSLPVHLPERSFSSPATFSTKESTTDLFVALILLTLEYI
jgi:hypothetical protein